MPAAPFFPDGNSHFQKVYVVFWVLLFSTCVVFSSPCSSCSARSYLKPPEWPITPYKIVLLFFRCKSGILRDGLLTLLLLCRAPRRPPKLTFWPSFRSTFFLFLSLSLSLSLFVKESFFFSFFIFVEKEFVLESIFLPSSFWYAPSTFGLGVRGLGWGLGFRLGVV